MQPWGSLARAAWCTTFALVLASACGGRSVERDDADTGGSSASRAGGSNTGSKPGSAGSSSTGSTTGSAGTGSSSSAGGSTGSAGTGSSSGGSPASACTGSPVIVRPDGGGCAAAIPRWTHDPNTGVCLPFIYGGCDGTANNYESLEACQKACSGISPGYDACQVATDCALSTIGCCGVCDDHQMAAHEFVAYNRRYAAQLSPCAGGDIACEPCAPTSASQASRKYFIPNCVRGECVVEDIRKSAVSACTTSTDCQLRMGTSCCQSCEYQDVVAVRNDGSLEKLVCGNVAQPCPTCQPGTPTDAVPNCDENGHCSVVHVLK